MLPLYRGYNALKHQHRSTSRHTASGKNQLRIIGGQWRGRKLSFLDTPGLRPTGDRIRETLFNWLAPHIQSAHCLDPFAGSGALAFEALSRGASSVTMLEKNRAVAALLKEHCDTLKCSSAQVVHTDAIHWLASQPPTPADLVFLDPPFSENLLIPCVDNLSRYGWLNADCLIYVESPRHEAPSMPANWKLLKEKTTGGICFRLFCHSP